MNTQQAQAREAYLRGRLESSAGQLAAVNLRLSEATARLALEPDVKSLLERLQSRVMSRSVGGLQALLTAILNDVFPEKGEVVLTVSSLRGAPALDIYLDNQGQLEDALTGAGGAVDNVLSTGLRYSALMRTQNRRLMVLDEPDCWMKPDRVPAFVSVLKQVSEDVGVQTLLVSHHDESFFTNSASIVRLYGKDGIPAVEYSPDNKVWPDDTTPGIRSIHLVDFKAHADTLLMLSPGMNAIIGENDLGKSTAVVAALRAVAYGESDDTCLRHGADSAQITLTLEDGKVVEWVRVRTGSPKVQYRVSVNGEVIHEGRQQSRGAPPEWVDEVLGIRAVDDLDIQLRSQKTPVFLLDEPPSRRAQVLSVGREASRLAEAMERYRSLIRQDRDVLNQDGKLKTRLEASVVASSAALELASTMISEAGAAEKLYVEAAATQASTGAKAATLKSLETALALPLPVELEAPTARDWAKLDKYAAGIARMGQVCDTALPGKLLEVPPVADATGMERHATRLRVLSVAAETDLPIPLPEVSVPANASGMERRAVRLRALLAAAEAAVPAPVALPDGESARVAAAVTAGAVADAAADKALAVLALESQGAVQALHDLKESLGFCPLCEQEFEHAH